jgi:lincosamide nucleotidyltransferase A/C/D/E
MEVTSDEAEHQTRTRFTVADVHWFRDLANRADIQVWLVGGWGVDALLGGETRPHTDLDIVVQQAQHGALRNILEGHGFSVLLDADHRPWNYVLVDAAGRRIDFHVVRFDEDGYGRYEPGFSYPPGSLVGDDVIGGVPVRCATPSFQIEDHLGYEPHDEDLQDVRALCRQYDLPLPAGFEPT